MHILENSLLCVAVKNKGAELSSIYKKSSDTEYLWQADPTHWGRHAPILFPIVGRLKEDTFYIGAQPFSMRQHGLARDLDFSMIGNKGHSISFELNSTEATLAQYPFPFRLQIQYTLKEKDLIVFYKVVNPAKMPMYFSIGGHPAFNCPLREGEQRSDYQLIFEKKETAATQRLTNGIRNGTAVPVLNKTKILTISDDLFDEDALVFQNLHSSKVSLQKSELPILSFDFKGFPYLGIWSKSRTAPFVCIEPWFGVADQEQHNQQLKEKEGILYLEGGNSFECFYTITIH